MNDDRSELRRLLGQAPAERSVRRRLIAAAAIAVAAFALGAGLLALAGWFIAASAVAGLAVASTFSFLFPSAGVQALAVARTVARYRERVCTHDVTLSLVGRLQTTLFERAVQLPRDRVAALRSSELLGRIMTDTDAVENVLLRAFFPALVAAAALIAVMLLALLSGTVALAATIGLLVCGLALAAVARRQARGPARQLVAERAQARRTLIEIIDGLAELRSFGAQQRAVSEIDKHLTAVTDSRRRLARQAAAGQSLGGLIADMTLLAVIVTAAGILGGPAIVAPAFVLACMVVIAASEPIAALPTSITARAKARVATARLTELFPARREAAAPKLAAPRGPWTVAVTLHQRRVEVALKPGDTALICGRSGAGKSTLLRAIAGEPATDTTVTLAGVAATETDPHLLAQHLTLVAQDAHIFDATIRDNLRLADPTAGDADLWNALAAAALEDTVACFPDGLDTPAGPAGATLSGGQRRRLSVAMGLLRRPDVLLLDEPTEGLDTTTASQLLAGVRQHQPTATLIIALHDRQTPLIPWSPTRRIQL